jgi:hypothetical protein
MMSAQLVQGSFGGNAVYCAKQPRVTALLALTKLDAAKVLADLTRGNVGRNLTIIIWGEVISTQTIRSAIEDVMFKKAAAAIMPAGSFWQS